MKSTLLIGIMVTMTIAVAGAALALDFVSAQMADNATMGNMTGGNMTGGNSTETTGEVSSYGGVL